MELWICLSKRLAVEFFEEGQISRCGGAMGVTPRFSGYCCQGLAPRKLGRISLPKSREELRDLAPHCLSLVRSSYPEIRSTALKERIPVLRLWGKENSFINSPCCVEIYHPVSKLSPGVWGKDPACNKWYTTPPLTKLVAQDSSTRSRNLFGVAVSNHKSTWHRAWVGLSTTVWGVPYQQFSSQ